MKQMFFGFFWQSGHFVCHLNKVKDNVTGEEVCDIEGSRIRISSSSAVGKVPEMALLDSTYSKPDQAPFRVDKVIHYNVLSLGFMFHIGEN